MDLQENKLSNKDKNLFYSFTQHLIDVYKEGNLVFIYRGESFKGLRKKLFSSNGDFSRRKLYERLFIVGDKARHFFMDKFEDSDNRRCLTNIKDCSDDTFDFIFERIEKVLSAPNLESRIHQSCSTRFLQYFRDRSNHDEFIKSINSCTKLNAKNRLNLRDYYLFFLHIAGSSGIRKETMLVSSSLSIEVAESFAKDDPIIIYGFIPQPYHNFVVSPWLTSEYHKIALRNSLPTYQTFGLFPKQIEISVKGALFPCFILGVQQIENKSFVINPHILNIKSPNKASKYGIPVKQKDFMKSILASKYMRFISTDIQGNFEQTEIYR
ncbi:hypothetical protein [Pseudanabaena yagii]|uniref:FRG domain-containing protein n=1 Tax=Pseudanabaena yagii GIHE-NHR1 TaxID=2722753 RepID=A0ABX1LUC9_9CYAN|nr:hypothetical protein [Pseudanabaena yagii]NMF59765.1 hypothetical protein [Pseudanabaena yagii GIHE-NHR1]